MIAHANNLLRQERPYPALASASLTVPQVHHHQTVAVEGRVCRNGKGLRLFACVAPHS